MEDVTRCILFAIIMNDVSRGEIVGCLLEEISIEIFALHPSANAIDDAVCPDEFLDLAFNFLGVRNIHRPFACVLRQDLTMFFHGERVHIFVQHFFLCSESWVLEDTGNNIEGMNFLGLGLFGFKERTRENRRRLTRMDGSGR